MKNEPTNRRRITPTSIALCSTLALGHTSVWADSFGNWGTPINLDDVIWESGPGQTPINTEKRDGCQYLSHDGLALYFASDRDTTGDMDLYVAERADDDDPFGEPRSLGAVINSGADDICPALSYDGRFLYFASARIGGCGDRDIYVAERHNVHDNLAWETPVSLDGGTCTVNSDKVDQGPSYFENRKTGSLLYFSSNRPASPGGHNIYVVGLNDDGSADATTLATVDELNTTSNDHRPFVREDGLEVFFDSNRPGSTKNDIWTAVRSRLNQPFSTPVRVEELSSADQDVRPVLNDEATELYLTSDRIDSRGAIDMYRATRSEHDDDDDGGRGHR